MKRLIPLLFLATPALAQQPPAPPEQQSWQIMYSREVEAHHRDLATAIDLNEKLQAAKSHAADLQKQIDDAKKSDAPK